MKPVRFTLIFTMLYLFLSANACRHRSRPVSVKPEWIYQAYQNLASNRFPAVKAVAWWNENWEGSSLRIDSSPEALDAYRRAVSPSVFITEPVFVSGKLVPGNGIYHAAFPDFGAEEDQVSAQKISEFEQLARKPIVWAYFSDNWYNGLQFPAQAIRTINQAGKIPFIRLMPRSVPDEYAVEHHFTLQHIIDGQFDADLRQWFRDAAAYRQPLLVEFGTEVNGAWFPWNGRYNGGGTTTAYGDPSFPDGPERFRDAYRHIIDLARQEGAVNITWFFHFDAMGEPSDDWNRFENYYPGDNYIDWIGVSAYGPLDQNDGYEDFDLKLTRVYDRILRMSRKPLAVLETGITEYQMTLNE